MDKIYRLKRSDENSELNDFPVVVARDHVDAIDVFAFDCCFKLEDCVVTIEDLFGVSESF